MDILGRIVDEKYREYMANAEFVERFRREAKAAGRLRHPNVVNVTDFGCAEEGDVPIAYLVMEYLDGCTLADVLAEEKRLSPTWTADIIEQICLGIDAAHQAGIVHRDLKPENIWLEPNRRGGYTIKVLDFGLAKLRDVCEPAAAAEMIRTLPILTPEAFSARMASNVATETETMIQTPRPTAGAAPGAVTQAGTILGTPLYMSPEQWRGDAPDARSDIYSLGVLAYQMLVGTTPFVGDVQELRRLHMNESPPCMRAPGRKIPRGAERVVMSALEKDLARRPQSATAFASALRANVEGVGPLLRRAMAVYGQHFQTFLQISFTVTLPILVIKGFRRLMNALDGGEGWDPEVIRISWWIFSFNTTAFGVVEMVTELFLTPFLTFGAFASVTAQLTAAPLQPVKLQSVFRLLKRRLRPFLVTSALYYACLIVGYALCVVPGVLMSFPLMLYPMIVIMEPTEGWRALRRSWLLVKRIRKTAVVVGTLDFLALAGGVTCLQLAFQGLDSLFKYQRIDDRYSFQFRFDLGATEELISTLIGIAFGPLLGIVSAMLYFKARQAGGETLSETLAEFEAANFPRAKWRKKMDAASGSQ